MKARQMEKDENMEVLDARIESAVTQLESMLGHLEHGVAGGVRDARLKCGAIAYLPIDENTLVIVMPGNNVTDMRGAIEVSTYLVPNVDVIICANEFSTIYAYCKIDGVFKHFALLGRGTGLPPMV